MVNKSSKDRVVGPLPNGLYKWLINGGDTHQLLIGMTTPHGRVTVDTPRLWKKGQWISQRLEGVIRRGTFRPEDFGGQNREVSNENNKKTVNLLVGSFVSCDFFFHPDFFGRK